MLLRNDPDAKKQHFENLIMKLNRERETQEFIKDLTLRKKCKEDFYFKPLSDYKTGFEVDNVIKIKSNLKLKGFYKEFREELAGQIGKITKICGSQFILNTDGGEFFWEKENLTLLSDDEMKNLQYYHVLDERNGYPVFCGTTYSAIED